MVNKYGKLNEVPLGRILPGGSFKEFLERQRDGLTGNLDKAAGFPFDTLGWDNPLISDDKNCGEWIWAAYEQTAYWLDGQMRCFALLGDSERVSAVSRKILKVVNSADADGYIGPEVLKEAREINRWPHVVFFRAAIAYLDYCGNADVLAALERHYLEKPVDYSVGRNAYNIEIMLLLYERTGNASLLELAEKVFGEYQSKESGDCSLGVMASNKKACCHGVSYNETLKLGVMLYIYTGKNEYLAPEIKAYKKIDKYQMLPDGLHSCNEALRDNAYTQTHEMCDVTDYTWSLGYMLMATGNGEYADKIEKCIFNAGIGQADERFKAIQYFSGVNQVVLDDTSNANYYYRGTNWQAFRPNPVTACCAGNCNRFMPNYCARMYMTGSGGIYAVLYGENKFSFDVSGIPVTVLQHTDYPFSDRITFEICAKKAANFKFYLRIPAWSKGYKLTVNGKKISTSVENGFICIDKEFCNDTVVLDLKSAAEFVAFKDNVYVQCGCLVYSLGGKGRRVLSEKDITVNKDFPKENYYFEGDWNYAADTYFKPVVKRCGIEGYVWNADFTPIKLQIKAKRIVNWKMRKVTSCITTKNEDKKDSFRIYGEFNFTPKIPDKPKVGGKTVTLELIPYATAKVRITVFPKLENCTEVLK